MAKVVLVHDPKLAHAIHRVLTEEIGARSKQYAKFMKLVREIAEAVGYEFVNPYDSHVRL